MKHILFIFLVSATLSHACASPILDQVREEVAEKKSGFIIMDLDETVIDTHGRKYHSYLEAHKELCGDPALTLMTPSSQECESALGLSLVDFYRIENGYSWQQLMNRVGLQDSPFIKAFNKKMVEVYLSAKLMPLDTPMPGASTYVRELKRLGAEVFFISSRYSDTQGDSTFEQLERLGFIEKGDRTHVILRTRGEDSLSFKTHAVKEVARLAVEKNVSVVGLFENEPENLNAWKKAFPEAQAILIKGNILVPTEPLPEIIQVEDYR